jgi:6-bladed beta-propeller
MVNVSLLHTTTTIYSDELGMMPTITITCPHCGFAKDTPKERVPASNVKVTCPQCRQGFPLSQGKSGTSVNPSQPVTVRRIAPPAQPMPEPFRNPSIAELPMEQGGGWAKSLLLLFILLIVILVGVRLWADGKKRSVPFPNFIATSDREVAINWGQVIYFLDHGGKVLRKQSLPQEIIPTQLKYVGDELWIGDYAGKTIKKLRNDRLETVVNGNGKFRGTFKFAADLQAGQIFVTDASNHKVHVFTADGKYLSSFGSEGKNAGQFKYPNTVVFDRDGNLLIVNTNAFRLDLFSRQGAFLKTVANVQAIGRYRFPTLLAQSGERLAFFNTIDLRQARVIMYGGDGQYLGELVPPKTLEESGDIAAMADKILITDNSERKVYQFSADTLAYQGPFSAELDRLGDEATRLSSRYALLANGSLVALLVVCVPVFFLYLRVRRRETKQVEATEYSTVIPRGAIWGAETNRSKMTYAVSMIFLSVLLTLTAQACSRINVSLAAGLLLPGLVLLIWGLRLMMESGFANPARREQVERLARAATAKLSGIFAPGEKVEVCTALQRSPYLKLPSLLLLTNRRILTVEFAALRPGACRQLGYGDIAAITLEPFKLSSGWLARQLRSEIFCINLSLTHPAEATSVQFSAPDRQILARVRDFLEGKRASGTALGYALLCDTCYEPVGPDGCRFCQQEKKAGWKPLMLSLLYPGLGQFYNREIWKGTALSVTFSAGIVMLVQPVITIMDRSAEFTTRDVGLVLQALFSLLFIYVIGIVDADQVGRKGRQIFSTARFKKKIRG